MWWYLQDGSDGQHWPCCTSADGEEHPWAPTGKRTTLTLPTSCNAKLHAFIQKGKAAPGQITAGPRWDVFSFQCHGHTMGDCRGGKGRGQWGMLPEVRSESNVLLGKSGSSAQYTAERKHAVKSSLSILLFLSLSVYPFSWVTRTH